MCRQLLRMACELVDVIKKGVLQQAPTAAAGNQQGSPLTIDDSEHGCAVALLVWLVSKVEPVFAHKR